MVAGRLARAGAGRGSGKGFEATGGKLTGWRLVLRATPHCGFVEIIAAGAPGVLCGPEPSGSAGREWQIPDLPRRWIVRSGSENYVCFRLLSSRTNGDIMNLTWTFMFSGRVLADFCFCIISAYDCLRRKDEF